MRKDTAHPVDRRRGFRRRSDGVGGRIIGTIILALLIGPSAFGQFLVQPMKMKPPGLQPGKKFVAEVKLENLSQVTTENISLRLVEVTQDPNGLWRDIPPDAPIVEDPNGARWVMTGSAERGDLLRVDLSKLRSCLDWLRLDKDSVEVAPFGIEPVKLYITVPRGTRGYYFAAILAESQLRAEEVEGMTTMTILQYLIPVILEIGGRPLRHEVELGDVGLEFRRQTAILPAATMVSMDITNDGGTYSRLVPLWRVSALMGGHWQRITEVEYPEMGIIPGVRLHLMQDSGKPLSKGKYRVEGYLYVDGKRGGKISKEIEYEGDPRVSTTKADVPLDLDPRDIFVEAMPNATRVGTLTVFNASETTVRVRPELTLPEHMYSTVNARGIRGESYGCADWVTVQPEQFELRGFGRKKIRFLVQMPESANGLPCYYATLHLHATYADGQDAGTTKAQLCIESRGMQGESRVDTLMLTVAELSPSRYWVTARFINNGDQHVLTQCRAALTTLDGQVRKRFRMDSDIYRQTGVLLPMDTRNFSGTLDLADVPIGVYRLTAELQFGQAGRVQDQRPIEVKEEGGQKIIQVLGSEDVPKTPVEF